MRAMLALGLVLAVSSCSAPEAAPPEPPAAKPVITPASGPVGTVISVAPTEGSCTHDPRFDVFLTGSLTVPLTGAVVASAFGSFNTSLSFGVPNPSISIVVPPGTAPGKYLVHLMCQGYYVDDYTFAPATFTVI